MESITLNLTYKTDRTPKGSDIVSFKILKKLNEETNKDTYIVVCYGNDLETLPGPEVYKKQEKGVDYLIGSNKYYNEEALPLMTVGHDSQYKFATEGEFKGGLAILNNGDEQPYINLEDIILLNLTFDNEKRTITFDRKKSSILTLTTNMSIKEDFYKDIGLTYEDDGRSKEILTANDILEQAILTMNYFETFKNISKSLGKWNGNGRRK